MTFKCYCESCFYKYIHLIDMCSQIKERDDWETQECHHSDRCWDIFKEYDAKGKSLECTYQYKGEEVEALIDHVAWLVQDVEERQGGVNEYTQPQLLNNLQYISKRLQEIAYE